MCYAGYRLVRTLFNQFNCTACHQFYGLGGYMGPDLTNVTADQGAAFAKALIMHGSARMPALGVSPAELASEVREVPPARIDFAQTQYNH